MDPYFQGMQKGCLDNRRTSETLHANQVGRAGRDREG